MTSMRLKEVLKNKIDLVIVGPEKPLVDGWWIFKTI